MKITSRTTLTMIFCVYLAAILVLCFIKGDGLPDTPLTLFGIPTDKLAHFCMFVPYPVLSFLSFRPATSHKGREIMILCVLAVLGAGFAYGTERLQGLTDYRSCDIADFYADIAGLCCGMIATSIIILTEKR